MTRPISIELHLNGFRDGGVLFDLKNYVNNELVATALTFDEVFACKDWRVVGTWDRLDVPQCDTLNLRKATNDLQDAETALDDLNRERYSCCDKARYQELIAPGGLIDDMERRHKALAFTFKMVWKSMTGMWPTNFRQFMHV